MIKCPAGAAEVRDGGRAGAGWGRAEAVRKG